MRQLPSLQKKYYPAERPLFHIATLSDVIAGAPLGIWIENNLVLENPLLRECKKDGVIYRFIAWDPLAGVPENAPMRTLHSFCSRSLPEGGPFGSAVSVDLYAESIENREQVTAWIEKAIANNQDPTELTDFAQRVLTHGYAFACEFVNILRREFEQYWLRTPSGPLQWERLLYIRVADGKWFAIDTPEGFGPTLLGRHWFSNEISHNPLILLKMIGEPERQALKVARPVDRPTFAEEMLATALVDLHQSRIRSAVLHAFIGYESAAKIGLDILLSDRFSGLPWVKFVDMLSRKVDTAELGQVVLRHAEPEGTSRPIDWDKITTLYQIRNNIVHQNQRQMPPFETVKDQVLEVRLFVNRLQAALKIEKTTPDRPK